MPDKKKSLPKVKTRTSVLKATEEMELLPFLIKSWPERSRSSIKSLLLHGQVWIGNKPVTKHNAMVKPGDEVVVNKGITSDQKPYDELKIVFEDKSLIVIEKNAGLLSVGTGEEREKTAYNILSAHVKKTGIGNKIFILHRLDRETSGLMIFAKSQEVQYKLQSKWDETVSERKYICIVEGEMPEKEDTLMHYLYEATNFKVYICDDPTKGQSAVLHYKVLKTNGKYSLLQVSLETGRKNQIRVQLSHIGYPIVGDRKYGAPAGPIGRLALHAQTIEFKHPATGQVMKFTTNIPRKFARLFEDPKNKAPKKPDPAKRG